MEKPSRSTALILLTTLPLIVSTVTAVITDQELDSAIAYLRSNGYNLFANGIATSDLRFQILDGEAFTVFSPRDSDVFSLDLASVATDYVQNLRHHVVPGFRLSFSQLRNLSLGGSRLETLLPRHSVFISNRFNDTVLNGVAVDGVRISVPDLYLGSNLTVHGLDGILVSEFRSSEDSTCDLGCMAPSVWPDNSLPSVAPRVDANLATPTSSPPEENAPSYFISQANSPHGENVSGDLVKSESLPPEENLSPEIIRNSGSSNGGKHNSQTKESEFEDNDDDDYKDVGQGI
ncbi:fasciclin-like arabinogalactan protein 19 [Vitis riparia]|uniref:fasciclin-like arabinogalactan protein 19 n=1 Tax=Vitis riparia TaxID=96939 RepID=UPI00155A4C24|nr:fasciclin-like arabinogalactan protein 19 [Vitis riparia]